MARKIAYDLNKRKKGNKNDETNRGGKNLGLFHDYEVLERNRIFRFSNIWSNPKKHLFYSFLPDSHWSVEMSV